MIGGKFVAVVNPVAGAAIVGGGFILSATGEGLTGYANYSQGDYGALAGQGGEFAAEQAVGHYFGRLGTGALRDAAKQLYDFEFDEVFRYTPEIAKLLSFLNHQFPEDDLSEEWLPGLATSTLPAGPKPTAFEYPDQTTLYDGIVEEAYKLQRDGAKGKTAIITMSRKSFDVVSHATRFANRIYTVDSRESLNRLQYVGGRIVFSMPSTWQEFSLTMSFLLMPTN